jgi:hypothetical protein
MYSWFYQILEINVVFDSFWRAGPALVLECYVRLIIEKPIKPPTLRGRHLFTSHTRLLTKLDVDERAVDVELVRWCT